MEIEFNTNSVGKSDPVKHLARPDGPHSLELDASFQTAGLEKKLKELSQVRPEKVEHAKALVSGPQYPPDPILKSIATLLALKLTN
jgi:hypothetical protein